MSDLPPERIVEPRDDLVRGSCGPRLEDGGPDILGGAGAEGAEIA